MSNERKWKLDDNAVEAFNQSLEKINEKIKDDQFLGEVDHPVDKAFKPIMRGNANAVVYDSYDNNFDKETLDEMSKMSQDELNKVIDEAVKTASKNEDISHLREIIENKPEVINHDQTITSETVKYRVKPDGKPDFTRPLTGDGELKEADIGIDEIDKLDDINKENSLNTIKNSPIMELSDDEAVNISQILMLYKDNRMKSQFPVFSRMIPSLRSKVNKMCLDMGVPLTEAPLVARALMDQFISAASEDEQFIDIENSLKKAMQIPSMVDIYMDHVNETMDIKLPEIAEKIKDTDPEKAEMLLKVKDVYTSSYLFHRLIEMYDTIPRLRKLVRKNFYDKDVAKLAGECNYFNGSTKFKMPDCSTIPNIVENITEILGYDKNDLNNRMMVNKFCVLLFGAAAYLKLDELLDASFYYYSIKNISMMSYVGEKITDFTGELISNINVVMFYIANREAMLDAEKKANSERSKKHI